MKTRHTVLLIILLTALLVYPVGCLATDPLPATLFTRDILPGDDTTHNIPSGTTFDIGSEDLPYGTGYFDNLIIKDLTTTRRILYSQTYWDDLRTPSSAIRLPQVRPPVETLYKGGLVLEFENQGAPNQQIIYFNVQMPHNWAEGTEVDVHVHWVPETDAAGTVIWQVTNSWANVDSDFPAETTVSATETIANQADQHILTDIVDLSTGTHLLSSMLICSLERLSGTDTYGDSVYFVEVDIHYQIDSPGSETELVK